MATAPSVAHHGEWFGHPKGLYILFFSEMWERFCYYGMRCILIYYMMKQLMFAQEKASYVYGLYTSAAYFIPFFGGLIADKIIGQKKTVIIGASIMAAGEFVLMVPSLFYLGLALMALGTGLFKPNVSTQVGTLYEPGDHRRDRAFNIFYMGINVGAILSPLICGTLGEVYGWKYGFMSAGIGLILGLIVYIWGQKYLATDLVTKKKEAAAPVESKKLSPEDYSKLFALFALCLLNVVYWGAYEQQGNTLAVWVDSNTDRHIFGWLMPATWFQNFNPIMIIAFIPLITWFWGWQDRRKKEPSSIGKMAMACFMIGASFLVLIPGVWEFNRTGMASLWWLAISTSILTLSEVYLSPIGLSLVTKLAPARLVSTIMGVWMMSWSMGQLFCGYIGSFYEKMPKDRFFGMIAVMCFATGIVMMALLKPLKKAIGHGQQKTVDV
ncbi:MAG: MFS transporter [Deltaproteobacteria bacterium CG11_big_fil_rev_8_21_14_0_20_49_13]|nr:MAG: MFS transporter [Deltaproteobacteria bacterium CG11_big_fil_rev_8_21_14_0_20_49_13]